MTDNRDIIIQKEFELDNIGFQIEAQTLKVDQIERSIKMDMPNRSANSDLIQDKKTLEILKSQAEQMKKGLEELNKQEDKKNNARKN